MQEQTEEIEQSADVVYGNDRIGFKQKSVAETGGDLSDE